MKIIKSASISGIIILGLCSAVFGGDYLPAPTWDRTLALETAGQANIDSELKELFILARHGSDRVLLERLTQLENGPGLSIPALELLLFRFTLGLGDLPHGSTGAGVLDHLAAYESRTLVSHEEQANAGIPLFNVRSAAQGVRHAWARQEAEEVAIERLAGTATDWIEAWMAAGPAPRKGFADALDYASQPQLNAIGLEASLHLENEPGLTVIAGKTALLSGDVQSLEHVVLAGSGPGLLQLFRDIPEFLSPTQTLRILQTAIDSAAPAIAALAIAGMGPQLAHDPNGAELLNKTAQDPVLGAAAKLALAKEPIVSKAPVKISVQADENARISEWVENAPASDNTKIALGYPVPIPVDTHLPFDGFRTYNGLHMRHQEFMNDTPWVHGHRVGQTRAGRDIWAYRLGDEDRFTIEGLAEPAMLTNGGIHAREWQTPETVTGIMELLAEQQGDDYLYSYLSDNVNVIVIPVLNVDGFQQTQRFPSQNWMGTDPNDPEFSPRDGRMRRKNMLVVDEDLFTRDDHLNGVDLNRNNPPYWATRSGDRSSPNRESIVHHGLAPQSEPETRALDAAAQLGPIEKLSMYTDVHSFSQVHFWVRNDNDRLALLTQKLLTTFTGHHAGFPAGKQYGFNSASNAPRNQGIGSTDEYFTHTYQVPAWTLEVEPYNNGSDYGGLGRNGHDGFILPESEINRVRTELAQTFAIAYYRQAGPPSITALRFIDEATDAVVFQAEWDAAGSTGRALHTYQSQALQFERNYRIWVAWNKPMRWRDNGEITVLPGQPQRVLDLDANLRANEVNLTAILNDADWLDQPGGAPDGYLNYRDDTLFASFRMPANANNQTQVGDEALATLEIQTSDMTGQVTDANPSTVARWENGAWTGYENSAGEDNTDTGGADSTIQLKVTSTQLDDPFLIEPGTSAAWFDPERNGEGFMLEILADNVAVLYWFTYNNEGEQDWYIAVGEVRANRIVFPELLQVSGGQFGPGFDPDKVNETVVGSASFIWSECDSGAMDWMLNDADGSIRKGRMNLQRLSRVMGIDCGQQALPPESQEALLSGSWFDPSHAGEGYTLEVLVDGRALVYWFSFDTEGKRRWFFGIGEIENGQFIFDEMQTTRNGKFGEFFDPTEVDVLPWGSLLLDIDCEGGTASFTPTEDGFDAGILQVSQLTNLNQLGCAGMQ